jgi:ribosomal protein S18 acetylase RimI-like enzyme
MLAPDEQRERHGFVAAASYTFDQLAEIYSSARVDYIVPMPMNGKRMTDYVNHYDIDLSASTVAVNDEMEPTGVVMLGLRGERSWITRLGVLPERRGNKVGLSLMEISIERSRERHVRQVQLEVITGNLPAYRLFEKLGFVEVRQLLVIRRPPSTPSPDLVIHGATITLLTDDEISGCLHQRQEVYAWTEETASLLHTPELRGIHATLPSGEKGWVIYQLLPFQVTHVVLNPNASQKLVQALLYQLHTQHPLHDTKIENMPTNHPAYPIFQDFGYIEVFSRIEMYLDLSSE